MLAATAVPATAGYIGTYAKNNVKIRTGPYTSSTLVGQGYLGQDNCMSYYRTGTVVDGVNRWWYHVNFSNGKRGYSAEERLRVYSALYACYDV